MPSRTLEIINKLGLHGRAAAKLVTLASGFDADIRIRKGEREVPGDSIMAVMMLAAAKGSELTVMAEGAEADAALDAIETLVNNRFDEEQ